MILVNKTWLKCAIMLTGRPTVPHLLPTVNPKSNPNSSSDLLTDKKLCYHRKTVWCTMSLKILSLTETSRTIQYNKSIYNAHMVSLRAESMAQKICATNRMELEGYSWSTCSLGQGSRRKYPNFWRHPNFLTAQCVGYVEGSVHAKYQLDSPGHFDTIPACDRQTDGHTMTANTTLA